MSYKCHLSIYIYYESQWNKTSFSSGSNIPQRWQRWRWDWRSARRLKTEIFSTMEEEMETLAKGQRVQQVEKWRRERWLRGFLPFLLHLLLLCLASSSLTVPIAKDASILQAAESRWLFPLLRRSLILFNFSHINHIILILIHILITIIISFLTLLPLSGNCLNFFFGCFGDTICFRFILCRWRYCMEIPWLACRCHRCTWTCLIPANNAGDAIDLTACIQNLIEDIICRAVMSGRPESFINDSMTKAMARSSFTQGLHEFEKLLGAPLISEFSPFLELLDYNTKASMKKWKSWFEDFMECIINEREKDPLCNEKCSQDMLVIFMSPENKLSRGLIKTLLMELFFAGIESTSTTKSHRKASRGAKA